MTGARIVALAVAVPWIAWAVLRTFGLERGHPLVSIVAVTPYVALTAIVPVIVALLLRRWWIAGLSALAAVVLIGAVLPRALGDDLPEGVGDGTRLTVMSINLFRGQADAEQVMRLARAERADVLSLQELDGDALDRLDAAGAARAFPQRAIALDAAGGGSGLLFGPRVRLLRRVERAGDEQPAATVVGPGGRRLAVAAVHPPAPTGDAAVREWRSRLEALPAAGEGAPLRILAGDFNATLDHRELREVIDRGYVDAADATGSGLHPTWRSGAIRIPITIDHVLVDRNVGVHDFSVHAIRDSDHDAVVAELALP